MGIRNIFTNIQKIRNNWTENNRRKHLLSNAIIQEPFSISRTFEISNLSPNKSNIKIGKGCVLQSQISVFEKGILEIGDYNYIGNSQIHCSNSVRIGRGGFFSDRILIFDGALHPLSARKRLHDAYNLGMFGTPVDVYSETCTQDFVEIGDAVWIGANSVITSGVKIGNGVIIGAGSVVTKDIPSWTLAVGNPARVVKHYDEEDLTFL